MFYEKEEAFELYQVTKQKANYQHYLITGAFDNIDNLSNNEFIILLVRWKKLVKDSLHVDDYGCVLNRGNLFVGVREDRKEDFLNSIAAIQLEKKGKSSLSTEILELSRNESNSIIG